MGEKATEATGSNGATTATAPQTQTGGAPAGSGGDSPLVDIDVSIDPQTGKPSVKFAYLCLYCGAPREVESGKYTSDCGTCGQTAKSGNDELNAVARAEHVPTFDRSSKFYP